MKQETQYVNEVLSFYVVFKNIKDYVKKVAWKLQPRTKYLRKTLVLM